MLRRAAELAIANGYDWFLVVGSGGDVEPPHSAGALSIGGGGGGYGGGYSGGGVGVGMGLGATIPISGGPRVSRSLEIVCGRNPRPTSGGAYDARSLIAALDAAASPPRR